MKVYHTDQIVSQGIKVLVYGRAGVGKTFLSSTAPGAFIISAENGLLGLRKMHIPFTIVSTLAELDEVYKWMVGSREARNYATFCLDSISEIAEVILAKEMASNKDPRKAYGEMATATMNRFRWFRDFPGPNVLFIAKEEYDKDEQYGGMFFMPSFPGKQLGPNAPYMFDEVFRLQILKGQDGQNVRAIQTQPDAQSVAKDRSGSLDFWEQANLTNIFAKIRA